jgi:hypothetical protein
MAGNTWWTPHNDVTKHPEDSILLAYLRKQQLEDRLSIIQHIEVEKCPRCLHKLNELKQVSDTLDVLGKMRSYQHYQELSVADTYARMQREASHQITTHAYLNVANHRQRPRHSFVRLISLPAAFGLAILFTVAMLVFANMTGTLWNPGPSKEGLSHSSDNTTVMVTPHATPGLNLTALAGTTPVVTPTRTSIKICSTPADIVQWRLVICGSNFEAGRKVSMFALVPRKHPLLRFNLPVDRQSNFQFGWNIVNCGNLPTIIYALEVTSSKPIFVKLQVTSFGSCSLQTPTSTAGPSGFSPK